MRDYELEEITLDTRRGRFIVPTADLSALGGCSKIQLKKLNSIIAPVGEAQ